MSSTSGIFKKLSFGRNKKFYRDKKELVRKYYRMLNAGDSEKSLFIGLKLSPSFIILYEAVVEQTKEISLDNTDNGNEQRTRNSIQDEEAIVEQTKKVMQRRNIVQPIFGYCFVPSKLSLIHI